MQIIFFICQSVIFLIQLGSAWTVNSTNREWIDLGSHREACMTIPETCGSEGGAVSLWMNTSECVSDGYGSFITTKTYGAGFSILFINDRLW